MNEQDRLARAEVLRQLPKGCLEPRPEETVLFLYLLFAVIYGTLAILFGNLPLWLNLLISTVLGNCYAGFFFFGHYLGHGSMVKTRWLREAMLFPCFWMLGMSPHMWKSWHHSMHHKLTNVPGMDPDAFGTIAHQQKRPIPWLFIPGNGRAIPSLFFLFTFFTGHVQMILWVYSRSKVFCRLSRLNRKRAIVETVSMFASICLLGYLSGPLALFTVLIPWIVANAITVSYTMTQHLLCPAPPTGGTLDSTMSVRVPKWLDVLHFRNSHHVEHHLFPEAPIKTLPMIRKVLLGMGQFKCPRMLTALRCVYYTPRFHSVDGQALIDYKTGRRVTHNFIDYVLKNNGPYHYIKP